jgi:hypothetical protein
MRFALRGSWAAALLAASIGRTALAQDPGPAPTPQPAGAPGSAPAPAAAPAPPPVPTPAAAPSPGGASAAAEPPAAVAATPAPVVSPAPAAAPAARIVDAPSVWIAKIPTENPYGRALDAPASLPPKLPFADAKLSAGFFVSVRVDATGKPVAVRRDRDPIPSLAAETMKSIQRWTITPARRGGQPVETWGAYRLDLAVEIDAPKITQAAMMPLTPSTPLPAPFPWPAESDWLDARKPPAPTDGTVSILEVDAAPIPQKAPWSADSFKGPFTAKYWVDVDKTGRITKAIPIEISDPVLLGYFRRAMGAWILKPAQSKGAPVESWNELVIAGQISFDDEIKQISALRRAIGP